MRPSPAAATLRQILPWLAAMAVITIPIALILTTLEPLEPMPRTRRANVENVQPDPASPEEGDRARPATERDRGDWPDRTRTPRRERDEDTTLVATPLS